MLLFKAILSGLVCLLSSIRTRPETLIGTFSKHSASCWIVWRPRPRHIDHAGMDRSRDTTSKCWISCVVSCKVSRDVGMNTCQYWEWLCEQKSIAAQDLLWTWCSWGRKWIYVILNFPQSEQLPRTQAEYLQKMLSRLQEVHHQASQHLRQAQLTQKKYYELKARPSLQEEYGL